MHVYTNGVEPHVTRLKTSGVPSPDDSKYRGIYIKIWPANRSNLIFVWLDPILIVKAINHSRHISKATPLLFRMGNACTYKDVLESRH